LYRYKSATKPVLPHLEYVEVLHEHATHHDHACILVWSDGTRNRLMISDKRSHVTRFHADLQETEPKTNYIKDPTIMEFSL
jgi:hypothetical protein